MAVLRQIDSEVKSKDRRKKAFFAVFVATCGILLMLFLVSFKQWDPPLIDQEEDDDVEVAVDPEILNFEAGAHAGGTAAAGSPADVETSPPSPPSDPAPPVLTNNNPDVSVPSGNPSNSDQGTPGPSNPVPNSDLMMSGNSGNGGNGNGNSNGTGDGDFAGLGDEGHGPPGPMGGGRTLLQAAPSFSYSGEPGKVVIRVYVDKDGNVLSSGKYPPKVVKGLNSSTDKKCINSAMKAKFDKISRDIIQYFDITFELGYQK